MDAMIQTEDLWKCYDDCSDHGTEALRGLNLQIRRGETAALFGRSGSGKSTLFNLIAGLDRPTRGRIFVDGKGIDEIGEKGRTRIRRERLGFIFQSFNLIPTLTTLENVPASPPRCSERDRGRCLDCPRRLWAWQGRKDGFRTNSPVENSSGWLLPELL